ncbi:MAG: hypothetical protein ACK559_12145, partial [bacterium]
LPDPVGAAELVGIRPNHLTVAAIGDDDLIPLVAQGLVVSAVGVDRQHLTAQTIVDHGTRVAVAVDLGGLQASGVVLELPPAVRVDFGRPCIGQGAGRIRQAGFEPAFDQGRLARSVIGRARGASRRIHRHGRPI